MATNPTVSSTMPTTADFARLIISLPENRSRNSANPTSAPSPSKKLKTQTNCPNGFPAESCEHSPKEEETSEDGGRHRPKDRFGDESDLTPASLDYPADCN